MINRMTNLPDPPLPILVTGLAGVSGYNAFHYFRERFPGQVIGIRQESMWHMSGEGIEPCDSEDLDGLKRIFDQYQFQSVLNCAGNCALRSCELDPEMAWRINHASLRNLIDAIGDSHTRTVHLSIDLVFSGTLGGWHVEQDPPDPVTVYGKTMAAGESLMQLAIPNVCTLRISLPMGISYSGHAGAIDWIQSRFKQNKPATLYYDEVRTPAYTDCLNRGLHRILASDTTGLFHCGGPRRLSLFEIAQVVNRVGGYDPRLLDGHPRIEAGPVPPRAGNVSMNSQKLYDLLGGRPFDPWPYDDALSPTHKHWHWERPSSERGSAEWLEEVLYNNPRYHSVHN